MITGAHTIIYSKDSKADRDLFRDIFNLTNVDVGDGWLIFGLPPAELAVHPAMENDKHELFLICDDIEEFVDAMGEHNIVCEPVQDQGWGLLTQFTLPGGGRLGVYEPRHKRPKQTKAKTKKKKAAPKAKKVKKSESTKAQSKKKAKKKSKRA